MLVFKITTGDSKTCIKLYKKGSLENTSGGYAIPSLKKKQQSH
jgi:hypothetical protein